MKSRTRQGLQFQLWHLMVLVAIVAVLLGALVRAVDDFDDEIIDVLITALLLPVALAASSIFLTILLESLCNAWDRRRI